MSTNSTLNTLDPDVARRIQQLSLVAKEASLGAISGIHTARRRGTSVEFAEHKEYAPGDDVRRIDWRAYARFDRYYLKQFQDEANLKLYLVFDHSGSMRYGNKLDYARALAAGLAHLGLNQRDAVGFMRAGNDAHDFLPARTRSTHFEEVVTRLVKAEAAGHALLPQALSHLAEVVNGRGLVVVLTDFLDKAGGADETLIKSMHMLTARGFEVSVLHVQHPDERDFPFESPAFFTSMEDARKLFVQPRILRQAFIAEMTRHRERVARELQGARIDHQMAWTDRSPAELLSEWLTRRMHLLRVRG